MGGGQGMGRERERQEALPRAQMTPPPRSGPERRTIRTSRAPAPRHPRHAPTAGEGQAGPGPGRGPGRPRAAAASQDPRGGRGGGTSSLETSRGGHGGHGVLCKTARAVAGRRDGISEGGGGDGCHNSRATMRVPGPRARAKDRLAGRRISPPFPRVFVANGQKGTVPPERVYMRNAETETGRSPMPPNPETNNGPPHARPPEAKGPQRQPQRPLGRRLEELPKRLGAVTVGYKCH